MSALLRVAAAALALASLAGAAGGGHVNLVTIDGSINPASSDYIQKAIARSEADGAVAVLIELHTPGGLVAATEDIVQAMLNADVPVIVYVSPQGSYAASAGTFITLAAHVAAMAPGTTIGAASPVGIGGGGAREGEEGARQDVAMQKAEKLLAAYIESIAKERGRNVEWAVQAVREAAAIPQDEALELGVIDLVARDRAELFDRLEGREVTTKSGKRVLALAGAAVHPIEMTTLERLFNFLSDPNIAVLLGMAGLLGLYVEFNQPGLIFPGVAGGVCLILAAIAFQILPFDWVGLVIMLIGLGLIVAEIFVTSFGLLFVTGIVCFLVGGSMLFDLPEVSDLSVSFWSVLVPIVAGFALIAGVIVWAVGRSNWREQTAGVAELIGLEGRSTTALAPSGTVFVRGEYWTATAESPIGVDERVEITAVEGLRLRVRPAPPRA